jgi:2-polyprenyl-6-methoxyphenol hydroxylase-like FAD-dependent oxidoreductase
MTTEVDVVVAGGGVAGSTAAAAFAALGWSVLVVEPGQHDERRLAGELIHPVGVAGLATLGLLSPAFASAARLDGFVVFPEASLSGCIQLPYQRVGTEPPVALALDHATICHSLLATVSALPGITVARGWRVTGLADTAAQPIVQMRKAGAIDRVRCRLVVAADGASSPVRSYAGVTHRRTRTAVLTGYLVDRDALPLPAHGHIFTAAGGPVLAYAIDNERARVLFNRPLSHRGALVDTAVNTAGLTARLRARVETAEAAGTRRRFVSSDVAVAAVARDHVALVGDAAGTCHPISASGMTMGIDDAMRLARALGDCDGDVAAGLARYAAERRSRQRARILLAAFLHDSLGGIGPEMGMLRAAMHHYWSGSPRARTASMALLAMDDVHSGSILLEFLRILACGFLASRNRPLDLLRDAVLTARLSRPMMLHLLGAMRVQ